MGKVWFAFFLCFPGYSFHGQCSEQWRGLQQRLEFVLLMVSACSLCLDAEQGLPLSQARRNGLVALEELEHCFDVENQCFRVGGVGEINATKVLFSFHADFNSVSAASVFYELMLRLGFNEFYTQGGDWGWLICTNLAQIAPK